MTRNIHSKYKRDEVIRIRPTGTTTRTTGNWLAAPIAGVLEREGVDRVELLTYPETDGTQTYCLHITTSDLATSPVDQTLNASLDGIAAGLSSTASLLAKKLDNKAPADVDLTPVSLRFDPLGASKARTSRAIVPANHGMTGFEVLDFHPFAELLAALRTEPHLCQVLLKPRDGRYLATIRTAVYRPEYQPSSDALKAWDYSGVPCDPIERTLKPLNLRSSVVVMGNYTLATSRRLRTQTNDPQISSKRVKGIRKGIYEYDQLLREEPTSPPAYTRNNYYPNIRLKEADLPNILDAVGVDREHNVWTAAPTRNPPRTESIGNADGTTTGHETTVSLGTRESRAATSSDAGPRHQKRLTRPDDDPAGGDDPDSDGTQVTLPGVTVPTNDDADATSTGERDNDPGGTDRETGPHMTEGTLHHQRGTDIVGQILREQGHDVHIVTQDGASRPDFWVRTPSGEIKTGELVYQSQSKPSKLLNNVARAHHWGYETIVVVLEEGPDPTSLDTPKAGAEWAINLLSKPFREIEGDRTRLYNLSVSVATDDGAELLLPDDIDDPVAEWWLAPDGTLELEVDGDVVASGDATDPIAAFDHELDRVRRDDEGRYVVEAADGSRRDTYPTKERFKENRTKLKPPHVPRDLSYLPWVDSVRMLTDEGLIERQPSAAWDTSRATDRHEGSIDDFFSTFIVERPDERLPESECRPFAKTWIGELTPHGPPANNMYGEYRKRHTQRRANNTDGGKNHFYDNMSWRFPRGLESPALPNFSDEPDLPEEWRKTAGSADASDDTGTQSGENDASQSSEDPDGTDQPPASEDPGGDDPSQSDEDAGEDGEPHPGSDPSDTDGPAREEAPADTD